VKGPGGRQHTQHSADCRLRRPFQSHQLPVDSWFKDGSNTKHQAVTLDMREAPLLPLLFCLLCPCPFQRLTILIYIYISCYSSFHYSHRHHIEHTTMQFAQASHIAQFQHSPSCKRNGLWSSCGGSIDHRSHQPLDPRQGLGNLTTASKRLYKHSRTARPSHWLLWRKPGLAFVSNSPGSSATATGAHFLPVTPPNSDMPPANTLCTTHVARGNRKHIGDGGGWACAISPRRR